MRAAVLVIAVLLAVSACSSAEDVRAAGPTLDPPGPEPTSSGPTNIQPTNTQPTNTEPTNTEPTNTEPAGLTPDFGVVLGGDGAKVHVVLYEDFQCPYCKQFEQASGNTLMKYVDQGSIRVEYRPIAFLDRMSSTHYSTRALNAAACVLDAAGPEAFVDFHDLLFANQPAEGSKGLSDARLMSLASHAGVRGVGTCIASEKFKNWTESATEAALDDSVNGTPTAFIDGHKLSYDRALDPHAFAAAIRHAVQDA